MPTQTIETASARVQELLAQDAAFRSDIDRCLREISEYRTSHRKATVDRQQATEEADRRLLLARRAAEALIDKAQAEAKKLVIEAEEARELTIKTARAPVDGYEEAMRSLDEERQLIGERRAQAREEYNNLLAWLARAEAEKAAAAVVAAPPVEIGSVSARPAETLQP